MQQIITFTEIFAKDVAALGYRIREENVKDIGDVFNFMKGASYLAYEIAKLDESFLPFRTTAVEKLLKISADLRAACDASDAVTIADILEYELLVDCEDILEMLSSYNKTHKY